MKISSTLSQSQFVPFELNLKFETNEEAVRFYSVMNYSDIVRFLDVANIKSDLIRDEIGAHANMKEYFETHYELCEMLKSR